MKGEVSNFIKYKFFGLRTMVTFKQLSKEDQQKNLELRIPLERPDLADLPFQKQLNLISYESTFVHFENSPDKDLSQLAQDVHEFEAKKSLGYYRAKYTYYLSKLNEESLENLELEANKQDLALDNIKARKLAKEALNMINRAIDSSNRVN